VFRRFRTKLTVLYAGFVGAGLLLMSVAVYSTVSNAAQHLVRKELESAATVFDRLWAMRSRQLQDMADVLSRDFGFREAVATNDEATIRSALANLTQRLELDVAMLVGVDGRVTASNGEPLGHAATDLLEGVAEEGPSGVLLVDGAAYHVVSAPILSPILTGWVVFGSRLDAQEMASLESLAAIQLDAAVLGREKGQAWTVPVGAMSADERAAASRLADRALAAGADLQSLSGASGPAIAVVKPLKAVNAADRFALMLRYPMAKAMAPYDTIIHTVILTALLGAGLLIVGSAALARSVTRPISELDKAAQRLREGQDATVKVESADEIGRLAESFNVMAATIREREKKLAAALDRAESANRLTNEFLANMSHEIRTPLNGVLGLTQVMAQTAKDPTQRELTAAVIESARGLEHLLCDILEAAQLRAGAAELKSAPFDLAATLQAVAEPWRVAAEDKGLAFELELAPEAHATVVGDAARLGQILNALLSNAVKFSTHGTVGLRARKAGEAFRFEVSDTGPGVDPAQKATLFAPFRQADGSATRKHGGLGLGLSVAHGFVTLMQGRLDCEHAASGGAVFIVELPLVVAAPPQRAVA
jgi:signal transduction histidine kinase